jgi:hypothetical protein
MVPLLFSFLFLQGCQAQIQGKYCNEGRDTRAQFGKDCRYHIFKELEEEKIDAIRKAKQEQ